MQIGSLVEYIGGQCLKGQQIFRLEKNTPYEISGFVTDPRHGKDQVWVTLIEGRDILFIIEMFKEIQLPMNIEINNLIEETITI